ncbi:MAG: protein kinase [Anaerolineae bacterium]|nr:protein kinase [Anaerolineae bacterium]
MNSYIGKTLGAYQLVEQIGQGGMATVFKAYQPSMDRYVAVKILPGHFTQDATFAARFAQEAHTLAHLEHPHILPVYDYGEQEGITYLVMRYIDAGTLRDLITDRGAMDLRKIARIMGQVGRALGHAHSQGIIHRDIKPSNVLIDASGNAFLTDFGIAKIVAGSSNFTGTGAVIGTPAYMAPEQGMGKPLDHRCDIYAMGVMLYEMVTGQVPFDAETPLAVMMMHVYNPLPLPHLARPDLPETIERIILKAMAKSPDDRFQDVVGMVEILEQAASGIPTDVSLPPIPGGPTAVFAPVAPDSASGAPAPGVLMPDAPTVVDGVVAPASKAGTAPAQSVGGKVVTQPDSTPVAPSSSDVAPPVALPTPPAVARPQQKPFPWIWAGGGAAIVILIIAAILLWPKIFEADDDGDVGVTTAAPSLAATVPVTATEAASPEPEATLVASSELVIDNLAPGFVIESGDWGTAQQGEHGICYEDDFRYANPDCTTCEARFRFAIGETDLYDVWTWWPRGDDRATDTPFTLEYEGNATTIPVDQRRYGSNWYLLATLPLVSDTTFDIVVAASESGYANADAVQLTSAEGWSNYVNYNTLRAIALQDDTVWAGGTMGLLRWNVVDSSYEIITVEEGLPSNQVSDVLLDGAGRLWVATSKGIALLSNGKWVVYDDQDGLDSSIVTRLFEDDTGGIWATTVYGDRGLSYYDGQRWGEPPVPSLPEDLFEPLSITGNSEWGLFLGLQYDGVVHYDGDAWKLPDEDSPLAKSVYDMELVGNDLYVGFDRGAARVPLLDPGAVEVFPQLAETPVYKIYSAKDGTLWFGGQGAYHYDPKAGTWDSFSENDHPGLAQYVTDITESDDALWFATAGNGLLKFDGSAWSSWEVPAVLGGDAVISIIQDKEGALWFSHPGFGLTRYQPELGVHRTFSADDGISDISGVPGVDSKGQVWVGSYGMLHFYNGTRWQVLAPAALEYETIFGVAFDSKDVMWVVGLGMLARYDPANDTWTEFTEDDNPTLGDVNDVFVAPDDTVWVACGEGLLRYDGSVWQTVSVDGNDEIAVDAIEGALDGSLWFVVDGDLFHFANEVWETFDWGYHWIQGLTVISDGTVWVWGTGVGHFDPVHGTWEEFSEDDGLVSDDVKTIWVTPEGVVWIGTRNGVSRYVP